MVTIYNKENKKIAKFIGKTESMLRFICENNNKLFKKEVNEIAGKVFYESLFNTEARIDIGCIYFWKGYKIIFEVS